MQAVGGYYNYFVTTADAKHSGSPEYARSLIWITFLYVVFIVLRSLLFALANLKESKRIANLTNNLCIYNHIDFYDRLHLVDHNP